MVDMFAMLGHKQIPFHFLLFVDVTLWQVSRVSFHKYSVWP